MKIEIINTGNELLLGTTLNTHGAWIGLELLKLGLRARRQLTVPDGDAIGVELTRALAQNDVVIVTGGIGPTSDDITREETAKALGLELIEDEFAVRSISEFFSSRNKEMAACNLRQAQSPVGADILPNHKGTAPGIYVPPRLGNSACAVFLLPGPPFELHAMFEEEVVPRLRSLIDVEQDASTMKVLSFLSVGESDFHQTIDAELNNIEGLEVGYCARPSELDLRLIGPKSAIDRGRQVAFKAFGEKCFTQDGESLEKVIVDLLAKQGKTIATAESCTGGAIASRLTDVSGSSAVFTHGYVTYANQAKVQMVGVNAELIETDGAVSESVAKAMAEGALRESDADIAISVTGIAGPTGGTVEKPVGTVWIGLAQKGKETIVQKEFHSRGRSIFKSIVSQRVLTKVWHQIIK